MKKINLLFIAGLLLMGSCSQDDIEQGTAPKGFAPKITASVEEAPATRAGVIEDGDYTLGEQFYWSVGDNASVLFNNISTTKKIELGYIVASVGEKRNQAFFSPTVGYLEDLGTYDVHGYFPTKAWVASTRVATVPYKQTQTDRTSKHLGDYMLMNAQSAGVEIKPESPINLQYKQLASMFRFAVWNATERPNLKLTNINVRLKSWAAFFGITGTLTNAGDASITVAYPVDTKKIASNINLELTGTAQDFVTKDDKQQCEGYMVALPSKSFGTNELVLTLTLKDGDNDFVFTYYYNMSTDLTFLKNGIMQGESYFFQLKIKEDQFANTTARPTIETVDIKAGSFVMGQSSKGSHERVHNVTLTKNFRMSKNLITNAQYAAFLNAVGVGSNGLFNGVTLIKTSEGTGFPWGLKYNAGKWLPFETYENHPVIYVSWAGADEFAKWVGGSLPTDAQWEYACRASTTTETHLSAEASMDDYAWYAGNLVATTSTHAVGGKLANPWGLHDMYGNVIEWCNDWHDYSYTSSATDPTGPTKTTTRVIRSGGWNQASNNTAKPEENPFRSAFRWFKGEGNTQNNLGFRIVLPASTVIL